MRRKAKDNILMVILAITFFLNVIAMNLYPSIVKELMVVGWIILGIGALKVPRMNFLLGSIRLLRHRNGK